MYTSQMPGKKDYVSTGNKVHVQKRLILSNLKELFAELKNTNPDIKVRNLLILRKIFSISEIICINLLDFVLKVMLIAAKMVCTSRINVFQQNNYFII